MIASKTIDCVICAFERPRYNKKKTLKSLGGKSVHGKKSLRFGMVPDIDQKISLLAGKNLA